MPLGARIGVAHFPGAPGAPPSLPGCADNELYHLKPAATHGREVCGGGPRKFHHLIAANRHFLRASSATYSTITAKHSRSFLNAKCTAVYSRRIAHNRNPLSHLESADALAPECPQRVDDAVVIAQSLAGTGAHGTGDATRCLDATRPDRGAAPSRAGRQAAGGREDIARVVVGLACLRGQHQRPRSKSALLIMLLIMPLAGNRPRAWCQRCRAAA